MRQIVSDEELFQRCDRHFLFEILIFAAGMMGAYTFMMRGEVFCNAQTLNVVMIAIELGQRHWYRALYYVIPISAYLGGAIVAQFLPSRTQTKRATHSGTYVLVLEILVLFVIGCIPLSAPNQIAQVAVNFIASMQFTTFRKSDGRAMATTFVTNHIRQIGIAIVDMKKNKDAESKQRFFKHLRMTIMFFAGAFIVSMATGPLQAKCIWLALIPMITALGIHIWADRA